MHSDRDKMMPRHECGVYGPPLSRYAPCLGAPGPALAGLAGFAGFALTGPRRMIFALKINVATILD